MLRICPPILAITFFLLLAPTGTQAWEPRTTGQGELVVIRTAPKKNPSNVRPDPTTRLTDQQAEVRIQQALDHPKLYHVHVNYFRRAIEFGADLTDEGKVIVVARHPYCKCRCDVEVLLPSGVPTVVHSQESITYLYENLTIGDETIRAYRVIIQYLKDGTHKVHYLKGRGAIRAIKQDKDKVLAESKEFANKLPITQTLRENAGLVLNTAKGAAAVTVKAASFYFEKVGQVASAFPGVKLLESIGEQLPERAENERIRQAGIKAQTQVEEFIKTNR